MTLRTRPSPIYTCRKSAVSADALDTDLETWNRDNDLVKAWWFPQEGQVQVWAARDATDDEAGQYHDNAGELFEHPSTSDAMNDTVDEVGAVAAAEVQIDASGTSSPLARSRAARSRRV